jgi:hypothetical protein
VVSEHNPFYNGRNVSSTILQRGLTLSKFNGKTFLYVGGVPRCGTMHLAAFVYLHEEVYMYLVMGGEHPPHPRFVQKMIERHGTSEGYGIVYNTSERDGTADPHGFQKLILDKNKSWTKNQVQQVPVLGVREDFAHGYFEKAKECEAAGNSDGRRVRMIVPVRRDTEKLFHSQRDMKLQNQHTIRDKSKEFLRSLLSSYDHILKLAKKYPDDVLITNVVDPSDPQYEYYRIMKFLEVTPTLSEDQRTWMKARPVVNKFSELIRDIVADVKENEFYQEYVSRT